LSIQLINLLEKLKGGLIDTSSRIANEMGEEGMLRDSYPDQNEEVISDFIFGLEERSQE